VEYYPQSNVGLLTYVVISPAFRGKGLARKLVEGGIMAIDSSAQNLKSGSKPYAYLAETNDPAFEISWDDTQNPRERVKILHRLGFCALNFPYVQPHLEADKGRFYGLKLLVHEKTWGPGEEKSRLKKQVLKNFLFEFYRELEGEDSFKDPEFRRMIAFIDNHPGDCLECLPPPLD